MRGTRSSGDAQWITLIYKKSRFICGWEKIHLHFCSRLRRSPGSRARGAAPAPPALPLPESAIPTDGHRVVRPGPRRYFRQESEREGVATAGQFLLFGAEKGKTKGSRPWAGTTALVGLQEESRAVLEELHLPGDPCAAQSQHAAPEQGTFRASCPVTKGKERLKKHQRALAQQDTDEAVGRTSPGQTTPPCWREATR